MKLLNKGSELSQRQKAWWVGEQMSCQRCGQTVELEYQDQEAVKDKITYREGAEIVTTCPTCKAKMVTKVSFEGYTAMAERALAITEEEFKLELTGGQTEVRF